jgi:hypothetical protein
MNKFNFRERRWERRNFGNWRYMQNYPVHFNRESILAVVADWYRRLAKQKARDDDRDAFFRRMKG